jgi:carboxymethylenebutenolidase
MEAGTITITGHEATRSRPTWPAQPAGGRRRHGGDPPPAGLRRGHEGDRAPFAADGYAALCPNLYSRQAPGASPDDAAAFVRAQGGIRDEQLVGDVDGAARHLRGLPGATGKVGVIGYCSGGRPLLPRGVLAALDAAVDCYGAFVVNEPPAGFPLAVEPLLGLAPQLSCPLLGLFGATTSFPRPRRPATLSAELDRSASRTSSTPTTGAGHAFFSVDRPAYRPEAAVDGWAKIFASSAPTWRPEPCAPTSRRRWRSKAAARARRVVRR